MSVRLLSAAAAPPSMRKRTPYRFTCLVKAHLPVMTAEPHCPVKGDCPSQQPRSSSPTRDRLVLVVWSSSTLSSVSVKQSSPVRDFLKLSPLPTRFVCPSLERGNSSQRP